MITLSRWRAETHEFDSVLDALIFCHEFPEIESLCGGHYSFVLDGVCDDINPADFIECAYWAAVHTSSNPIYNYFCLNNLYRPGPMQYGPEEDSIYLYEFFVERLLNDQY